MPGFEHSLYLHTESLDSNAVFGNLVYFGFYPLSHNLLSTPCYLIFYLVSFPCRITVV